MNLLYALLAFALSTVLIYVAFQFAGAKLASLLKKHGRPVKASFQYRAAAAAVSICFGILTVVLLYTSDTLASVSYEKRSLQYELEELQNSAPVSAATPSPVPSVVNTSSPSSANTPSPAATSPAAPANSASPELVWVSASGTKYHCIKTCSNMSNPQQISQADAEANGLTPCKRCYS